MMNKLNILTKILVLINCFNFSCNATFIPDDMKEDRKTTNLTTIINIQELFELLMDKITDSKEIITCRSMSSLRLVSKQCKEKIETYIQSQRKRDQRLRYVQSWVISTKTKDLFHIDVNEQYFVPEHLKESPWSWDAGWEEFKSFYWAPLERQGQFKLSLTRLKALTISGTDTKAWNFKDEFFPLDSLLRRASSLKSITFLRKISLNQELINWLLLVLKGEPSEVSLRHLERLTFGEEVSMNINQLRVVVSAFCSSAHLSRKVRVLKIGNNLETNYAFELYKSFQNKQERQLLLSRKTARALGKYLENLDDQEGALLNYRQSSHEGNPYASLDVARLHLQTNRISEAFEIFKNLNINKLLPQIALDSFQRVLNSTTVHNFILSLTVDEQQTKQELLRPLNKNNTHFKTHLQEIQELLLWVLFKIHKLVPDPKKRAFLFRNLKDNKFINSDSEDEVYAKAYAIGEELEKEGKLNAIILMSRYIAKKIGFEEAIKFLRKERRYGASSRQVLLEENSLMQAWLGYYNFKLYKKRKDLEYYREAVTHLANASDAGHVYPKIQLVYLLSFNKNENINKIIRLLEEAAAIGNSYAQFWLGFSFISGNLGVHKVDINTELGKRFLEDAKEQNNSWALYQLGKHAMDRGDFKEALEVFEQDENSSLCLDSIGFIYMNPAKTKIKEDYSKAERCFEKAARIDENNYSIWRNWGWLRVLQYNQVSEQKKNNWRDRTPDTRNQLLEDAENYTRKALEFSPENKKLEIERNLTKILELKK